MRMMVGYGDTSLPSFAKYEMADWVPLEAMNTRNL